MNKSLFSLILISIMTVNTALFASYDEALKLYQEKRYKDSLAKIATDLVVGRDTDAKSSNYELRYLAAHNHWRLGNVEAAISHFKRCSEIQKDISDPLVDLALMLVEFKKYKDAEIYAARALGIQKTPMVYYVIGKSAYGAGNFWRAKEFYEKAISLDPELYAAYNGLGCSLLKLGKFTHANTAFSAALSIAPSSPEILNNMGLCLEKMGKNQDAKNYYKKAIDKNPDNPVIVKNLSRVSQNSK